MVAQQWRAQFEWYAHAQLARKAGISQGIIDAIHRGEKPASMDAQDAGSLAYLEQFFGRDPRSFVIVPGYPASLPGAAAGLAGIVVGLLVRQPQAVHAGVEFERAERQPGASQARLELVDSPSADGVLLSTGDGKLLLKLDKKSSTVELTSSGPVKITGMGVTVDAGAGVLELKGQQVKVTGQAQAELTASGSVTVRGGVVRIN